LSVLIFHELLPDQVEGGEKKTSWGKKKGKKRAITHFSLCRRKEGEERKKKGKNPSLRGLFPSTSNCRAVSEREDKKSEREEDRPRRGVLSTSRSPGFWLRWPGGGRGRKKREKKGEGEGRFVRSQSHFSVFNRGKGKEGDVGGRVEDRAAFRSLPSATEVRKRKEENRKRKRGKR